MHTIISSKLHNHKIDALWVSQNHGDYHLSSLITYILKKSIHHKILIASNNLSWINKGIFIGLYPDNTAFGKEIAARVNTLNSREVPTHSKKLNSHVYFMKATKLSINKRTSRFIGIPLNAKNNKEIDLIFPKK